jgi:hypothetical protein
MIDYLLIGGAAGLILLRLLFEALRIFVICAPV